MLSSLSSIIVRNGSLLCLCMIQCESVLSGGNHVRTNTHHNKRPIATISNINEIKTKKTFNRVFLRHFCDIYNSIDILLLFRKMRIDRAFNLSSQK